MTTLYFRSAEAVNENVICSLVLLPIIVTGNISEATFCTPRLAEVRMTLSRYHVVAVLTSDTYLNDKYNGLLFFSVVISTSCVTHSVESVTEIAGIIIALMSVSYIGCINNESE